MTVGDETGVKEISLALMGAAYFQVVLPPAVLSDRGRTVWVRGGWDTACDLVVLVCGDFLPFGSEAESGGADRVVGVEMFRIVGEGGELLNLWAGWMVKDWWTGLRPVFRVV